ncbi:protein translocase subunit SecF [Candidatus Kuenenbacteria bacterium HGW-Kuenenbacteria-1]|uniref:Protein-export membrane protein SecF n=1 Tax=Candidatus Kuenenbacteria bacterium HGW-Kuenenbacteria-1 TaxID=2013812 RepID=A0A2N1UNW0_9BACT|nr:MAG: protein translocase subunit SecF [Candidatus Kuenenbacteria bacterium HGW-Kuenenbacteria-1]
MNIIKHQKIYFFISSALVIISIASLIFWQLKPNIDFTGGTLMEIEFKNSRPTVEQIKEKINTLNLGEASVQLTNTKGVIIKTKSIEEEMHQQIITKLQEISPENKIEEKKFESIGPTIGKETKEKAIHATIIALIIIIIYIAWAFRKISKPISSWKYGLIAIIVLVHDIIITLGAFSLMGHFLGIEIGATFIIALLTILGYSNHDTIIIFDRLRENLLKSKGKDFEDTVNISINETIVRSINTSLTVLLSLFAVFFFGGASVRDFILALIIGITAGTYSSIFVACPTLVVWERIRMSNKIK